ncbi:hypothetical protein DM02DRAFT_665624 [Periconia macrospinosa]|uniref:Uncharacterized protein n=1 Tax=Periconia macrospinosa TaxID=97972 RepID=A0A2V1CWF7_9PLEO|nr:hypothetical protein DM02DRAFT_665624 [Periconia macrospinosa]
MTSSSSSLASAPSASLAAVQKLNWDFYSFFRIDYPNKDQTQPGKARKTLGRREYVSCSQSAPAASTGQRSFSILTGINKDVNGLIRGHSFIR